MTLPRPQRITPPAAPGALLKPVCEIAQIRKVKPELADDPDYLALVRQCPCLYCGVEPCGEAAHVRLASAAFGKSSGLQKKPHDQWALPLCRDDHLNARHAQHKRNEEAFWRALGINPLLIAQRLYAQRGDLVAMRAVAIVAISERTLHPGEKA
ncbi:Protein of unknown function (DUF968) [Bradyrhizobium sp. YR681]|uniref:DUF968 domain-containing protein n=1 Tax=Bradyrhizobium sp. YR681 TaxID=1144344 RepID=UPI00026F8F3A|nr:DUF968 domain-containing protein [Bradyrhizobium sp. YR681]EJN07922.1 Protein of unknown function (DUF968) [Bradyrhizobium sp. YR681]